jgi:peptidyl-dipeptidase Dcp
LQFGENVLAETQGFELHITNDEDLSGLPEGTIEAARSKPRKKRLDLHARFPSYVPFVTYADNRELRKKMAIALAFPEQ